MHGHRPGGWFGRWWRQRAKQAWAQHFVLKQTRQTRQTRQLRQHGRCMAPTPAWQLHSPSKCFVWVKKCCHVCLGQNFVPSLLTSKLWLVFMRKKQKKIFFSKKKIQNGRLKKTTFFKIANSQNFFTKISQIGPWVSRIDWCEGH